MASIKRTAPVSTENMLYKTWRNKIDMWQLVTSAPKKITSYYFIRQIRGKCKSRKSSLGFN